MNCCPWRWTPVAWPPSQERHQDISLTFKSTLSCFLWASQDLLSIREVVLTEGSWWVLGQRQVSSEGQECSRSSLSAGQHDRWMLTALPHGEAEAVMEALLTGGFSVWCEPGGRSALEGVRAFPIGSPSTSHSPENFKVRSTTVAQTRVQSPWDNVPEYDSWVLLYGFHSWVCRVRQEE